MIILSIELSVLSQFQIPLKLRRRGAGFAGVARQGPSISNNAVLPFGSTVFTHWALV